MSTPAILALEDGSVLRGESIGAAGMTAGEVCFNTAMCGYQEICTDPSYYRQLVTLTYPHIGNTGVNSADEETSRPMLSGLIIRDLPPLYSNWRADEGLSAYLQRHNVVAIAEIDTRRLTRLLRERGAQRGCIMAGASDPEVALAAAREFPGLAGMDLAREVSTSEPYEWRWGSWRLEADDGATADGTQASGWRVVAYDYGVKRNILRWLVDSGCEVTVVPARTPAAEVLARRPHGVVLANGPGDPEPCDYAITATRELLAAGMPVFGICLGHQILALAAGARTVKMKFGHHGANHPVIDLATGRVMISSQNHGFAVDEPSLPANVRVTQRSLFDDSVQGMQLTDAPAFSFQGHPEASPGPRDVAPLFQQFVELMAAHSVAAP